MLSKAYLLVKSITIFLKILKKYKEYIELIKYREYATTQLYWVLLIARLNVIGLCWAASPKLLGRAESG